MNISIPKGVFDIVPFPAKEELMWQSSHLWRSVENTARQLTELYGFGEIRTPLFERTELFQRGVGKTSDIVTKEMYTFDDKGGRSMTLRPEGTAAVLRSFLEKVMYHDTSLTKLFYIAPMFRYERQQAGRYRQHHQFGVEAIGSKDPELDAEVIDLMYSFYRTLGLKNITLHVNSIGDVESHERFRKVLQETLRPHLQELSQESKERFEKNPLRILDSKDPRDRELVSEVPSILDYLTDNCRDHFEAVCSLLSSLNIPYVVNPMLVRGLDYYNNTVFEATAGELGAQNSIGGGGRYDGLIKTLGGPDLPALGFGIGIERVIMTLLAQKAAIPEAPSPSLYIIPLGSAARTRCASLIQNLRRLGISTDMDYTGRKLKKIMGYANSIKTRYTIVIGDEELSSGRAQLKDMISGSVNVVDINSIENALLPS